MYGRYTANLEGLIDLITDPDLCTTEKEREYKSRLWKILLQVPDDTLDNQLAWLENKIKGKQK